jgi:hypothetical protein
MTRAESDELLKRTTFYPYAQEWLRQAKYHSCGDEMLSRDNPIKLTLGFECNKCRKIFAIKLRSYKDTCFNISENLHDLLHRPDGRKLVAHDISQRKFQIIIVQEW